MTLSVTVIVALLMLVVLGYQFNEKDGKIEQGGLLQFQTTPSGAKVTVDGRELSSTTTTKTTVDSGVHTVLYNKDGYRQWQKTIKITPGQIGWLSYARLIPNTVKTESVHDFNSVADAVASSSRKYILVHEKTDTPEYSLVDLRSDIPKYTPIVLPATSYTVPSPDKTQSFTVDSWSVNDDYVLIKHTYDDTKIEWIVLDRNKPEQSINITTTYAIDASSIQFSDSKGRLLFVQVGDVVRRLNLDEQTLSRPLATKVASFEVYDDKTITYTTLPENGKRSIGYAAVDIAMPVTIEEYPDDGKVLLTSLASYFGDKYLSVLNGNSLIIKKGSLPTLTSKADLKVFGRVTVPLGVTRLQTSNSGRFTFMTYPDGYGTYDLEFKKFDRTLWAQVPVKALSAINMLDDFMLWSTYGGELWTYEFDGANRQNIMPVIEGLGVTLSTNNKYIYGFNLSEKGVSLQRGLLQLP